MNNVWIGAIVALAAGYQLLTGRISLSSNRGVSVVHQRRRYLARAEQPVFYWLVVGIEAILALVLLLGVIRF